MTKAEMKCYKSVESDVNLYWLPGLWFTQNLQAAFRQGRVKDAYGVKLIMEVYSTLFEVVAGRSTMNKIQLFIAQELLEFRGRCGTLWLYAWINIPLLYTQVISLCLFFLTSLF